MNWSDLFGGTNASVGLESSLLVPAPTIATSVPTQIQAQSTLSNQSSSVGPGLQQVQPDVLVLQGTSSNQTDLIDRIMAWTGKAHLKEGQVQPSTSVVNNLKEIVTVNHDGAWRELIEIELMNENGENFYGSITLNEAKHGIYRDCLGFTDFKNFDGVRLSFKGQRIVTFKLKEQIDVDNLLDKQHFEYKRSFKRHGKLESVIVKCKIRGLRSDSFKEHLASKEAMRASNGPDGSVMVKITGCEYKVTEERLKNALSYWGSVTTTIQEEVFTDPHDSDGTNRTGIYTVRMIMESELPEMIPLDGLRLKIQYQGVSKLCTGCYGKHLRKNCSEPKITWLDYIKIFRSLNPEIPDNFYGQRLEKLEKKINQENKNGPRPEDYNLPRSETEWNSMMSKMNDCGIDSSKASEIIREREKKFVTACEAFKNRLN